MALPRFWAAAALRILVGLFVLLSMLLGPKNFVVAKIYGEDEPVAVLKDDNKNNGVNATPSPQRADNASLNGGNSGAGGSGSGRFHGGGLNAELCDADISSFLPPPYGNISGMACSPVWNTLILRYTQRDDNVMTIVLSAVYTSGWVGIGFSRDGMMAGSSAMVGWFNKKGQPRIKQYYLQGARVSQVIPGKGELPIANVPPVVVLHGPMIYMAFQVHFQHRLHHQPLILAFGTRYPHHLHLTHHDDKTTIMFDFSAGSATAVYGKSSRLKRNHGILGIFGWGLFLPIGAIVARHLRHRDPLWYYLHAVIQLLGFIFMLATVLLGTQLFDKRMKNVQGHRGIGIFALFLCILQVLAFFLRPNKEAKIRRYWNWYHHWFGRIALFFGAVNIVLGMQIGYVGSDWKTGYGFLLAAILVAVIILEVLLRMKRSREKSAPPPTFQMNTVPVPQTM